MSSCEKCWVDSQESGVQYSDLVKKRDQMNQKCTPEEQAGRDSTLCRACDRKTIHQFAKCCMNPDCLDFNRKVET